MKATRPIDRLAKQMAWTGVVPPTLVRFVGVAEFLGAIGLVLPMLTGIAPSLTVAAALGLVLVQVLAIIFHVNRRESASIPMNAVLLILAAVIAYGRLAVVPA
jgi:hypothetical protein